MATIVLNVTGKETLWFLALQTGSPALTPVVSKCWQTPSSRAAGGSPRHLDREVHFRLHKRVPRELLSGMVDKSSEF